MPSAADTAAVFAALGDETRLALLAKLGAAGPLPVSRLAEGTTITRQAVSKHLAVLARAGLVRDARSGREHLWAADAARIAEARRTLDVLTARWEERLAHLKARVEADAARNPPATR